MTSEQLEASRAERLRLNGNGALTLEDARTWIEETGLCLFLPRRQFSVGVAPSFVEAISGTRNPTPDPKHIALAEELLVRLEADGVAVRLNLLGQPGEQPDFVVAAWVLPYVYALRGDRDWRRSPQLTGSRQVSQLAIQAYKLLESGGDATIPQLKHTLGKEVTEGAVLRAITELWQQLRIIPIVSAPGRAAQWQLLRQRFQKAIAEGASTSQVTAISVLASIYLQAVIAASMEEVELFLAPLTARSKVREVLRGLVATRQVHTISMGHAPHFYVAGTLPEFAVAPTIYASSAMAASSYFLHAREHEEEPAEHVSLPAKVVTPVAPAAQIPGSPSGHAPISPSAQVSGSPSAPAPVSPVVRAPISPAALNAARIAAESQAARVPAAHQPASNGKPAAARPHFSRPAARSRDRKPAQASSSSRPARRPNRDTRPSGTRTSSTRPSSARTSGTRTSGTRSANGSRATSGARWTPAANGKVSSNGNGRHNGTHANGSSNGSGNGRHNAAHGNGARGNGTHSNGSHGNGTHGNGTHSNGTHANGSANGSHANGNGHGSSRNGSQNGSRNGHASNGHASGGVSNGRNGKTAPASRTQRNGRASTSRASTSRPNNGRTGSSRAGSGKPAAKPTVNARGSAVRKDTRAGSSRKPALTAGAKAGNSKRYGFTAPAKQGTKKRG